jgi:hypothetical protein
VLLAHVGGAVSREGRGEAERGDLVAIGVRGETAAAGRRQAGARQRREIGGLRPDTPGVARRRTRERHDKPVKPCGARCGG